MALTVLGAYLRWCGTDSVFFRQLGQVCDDNFMCTISRWHRRAACRSHDSDLLLTKTQSEQFAAVLLAVIGAIYIGFGLQLGSRGQIVTELTVAAVFIAAAMAAIGVPYGSFPSLMWCMEFGTMHIIKV